MYTLREISKSEGKKLKQSHQNHVIIISQVVKFLDRPSRCYRKDPQSYTCCKIKRYKCLGSNLKYILESKLVAFVYVRTCKCD